ncbi:helix-turn-helix transcriptional regulator [uncultured Parolsenella sp.]|uniref:helix-turn-helix transcriptional regulator n=1 Tax=uncultured Parolsenella sp. TaxID=2083008 RepID=UPI0025E3D654|nr:helix-turn-helix domain-containing protein [uncultured Parolsenella sp.]
MATCTHRLTKENYSSELSRRMRMLRFKSGYTQEEVAQRAGISTYTYQKFEKGESRPGYPMNPTLSTLIALSDVFDIDVRDLFTVDYDAFSPVDGEETPAGTSDDLTDASQSDTQNHS